MNGLNRILLTTLVLAILSVSVANADIVSATFTGTVAYTPPALPLGEWQAANSIYDNEPVTFTLTYDTSLFNPGTDYNSTTKEYTNRSVSAGSLTVQVGTLTFTADDPTVFVNSNSGALGFYFVPTAPFSAGTCTSAGANVCVDFIVNDTSVRTSNLPTSFPQLTTSDLESTEASLVFFNSPSNASEGLQVFVDSVTDTSPTNASTPEVSSFYLLATMMFTVFFVRIIIRRQFGRGRATAENRP